MTGLGWVFFTVAAAAMQTLRNALQRKLTRQLGTLGATHVRFLFGLPFALCFLLATWWMTDLPGAQISARSMAWTLMGGLSQIGATALMLAAMRQRAFVIATAYIKTEPLQIALFAFVFLGERMGLWANVAMALATLGVLLMSWPSKAVSQSQSDEATQEDGSFFSRHMAAFQGIAAGALFAMSAVGFRGGILALGDGPFYVRATLTLAIALVIQTTVLTAWLLWRHPGVMTAILRAWKTSLLAGATGAIASQLWFFAFALQSAAAVRTLALIELLFAQIASRTLFSQRLSPREGLGLGLMVIGLLAMAWV